MANKKVKPSEDYYDFLPQRVQESTKLNTTEKNVLATLCYYRLKYSDQAKEHDGWFYISQKKLEEGAKISHAQLNRVITKLRFKKPSPIQTKSGTNHSCTNYKLHPKIEELLPKDEDNETLIESHKNTNDTLVEKTTVETHNETLDKIRLDKSSKDLDSLISKEDDDIGDSFGEEITKSSSTFNEKEFYNYWYRKIGECDNLDILQVTFREMVFALPSKDAIKREYLENLQNKKNILECKLKSKKK